MRRGLPSAGLHGDPGGQNQITLRGQAATVSGKPDLIARLGDLARIIDTKTGGPRASHHAQVMLYMYLLPLARPEYQGCTITGQVVYEDHVVDIPADAVDERFINSVKALIQRIGSREPAVKAPRLGPVPLLRHHISRLPCKRRR